MKGNDRITHDNQVASLARMTAEAAAKGFEGYLIVNKAKSDKDKDEEILITGIQIPLTRKYLNTMPFKFGGNKKKASNSGGCGRAGRRNKNPRFPKPTR